MVFDIGAWLRQPTTINGIGSFFAVAVGAATHYLTGDATATAATAGLVFSAVHLAMPDNSAAPSAVEKLFTDAITAATQKHLEAALPQLLADGVGVMGALPVPVQPAPAAVVAAATVVPTQAAAAVTSAIAMVLAAGLLSACTATQIQVACQIDQKVVPISDATLSDLVPATDGAVTIDQVLLHPAVVKFCQDQGGAPVAVAAAPSASTPSTTSAAGVSAPAAP